MRMHGFIVLKTVAVCFMSAAGMRLCPCRWMQNNEDTAIPWWDQGVISAARRLKATPPQEVWSCRVLGALVKIGVTGFGVQGIHEGPHTIASRSKICTRTLMSSGWGIAKLHVGGNRERRAMNRRINFTNSKPNAWPGQSSIGVGLKSATGGQWLVEDRKGRGSSQ